MADNLYAVTKVGDNVNSNNIKEYIISNDSEEVINALPRNGIYGTDPDLGDNTPCHYGSTALCPSTGSLYILDVDNTWKKMGTKNSGGSSQTDLTGVLNKINALSEEIEELRSLVFEDYDGRVIFSRSVPISIRSTEVINLNGKEGVNVSGDTITFSTGSNQRIGSIDSDGLKFKKIGKSNEELMFNSKYFTSFSMEKGASMETLYTVIRDQIFGGEFKEWASISCSGYAIDDSDPSHIHIMSVYGITTSPSDRWDIEIKLCDSMYMSTTNFNTLKITDDDTPIPYDIVIYSPRLYEVEDHYET